MKKIFSKQNNEIYFGQIRFSPWILPKLLIQRLRNYWSSAVEYSRFYGPNGGVRESFFFQIFNRSCDNDIQLANDNCLPHTSWGLQMGGIDMNFRRNVRRWYHDALFIHSYFDDQFDFVCHSVIFIFKSIDCFTHCDLSHVNCSEKFGHWNKRVSMADTSMCVPPARRIERKSWPYLKLKHKIRSRKIFRHSTVFTLLLTNWSQNLFFVYHHHFKSDRQVQCIVVNLT